MAIIRSYVTIIRSYSFNRYVRVIEVKVRARW